MEEKKIVISGGGLVGSLLALLLGKAGYEVDVYEKRPDPLMTAPETGRSINLALSHRGIKALQAAGVEQETMNIAIPMKGRFIHHEDGTNSFQPYGEEGQVIYAVSRADLNKTLLNKAREAHNVKLFFNERCVKVNIEEFSIEFENKLDGTVKAREFSVLFGADGAFSQVRSSLLPTCRFNYSQEYLEYGYKELTIPSDAGAHRMEKNALHIWPREKFMLIALPNLDGTFTATLFLPFEGENSFESLKTDAQVETFFKSNFADAADLIPELKKQFAEHPTSALVTVKCYPWVYENRIALIGDAAHAIVPFYGQGMNAGFEDCRVLYDLVTKNWSLNSSLQEYQKLRKPAGDAVGQLALQNFIEMRDLVNDKKFLLRKKIEAIIHHKIPGYLPLYSMVTFSDLPYHEALEKGQKQERLMEEIMKIENIEALSEDKEVWEKIEEMVKREMGR
ncbi:kynurenine 3-monooxygenase [Sporocytophaga myxococcoides]|uniref:Kynurenine 3-monooxygenase n=2 Tax=Sporocytophaga myxococcoides TaxID=153721 RepID=A0A098LDF4_9BACT|nr:kynurenine 3-monooxygenase [Sporocytophaga myxococcoides]